MVERKLKQEIFTKERNVISKFNLCPYFLGHRVKNNKKDVPNVGVHLAHFREE